MLFDIHYSRLSTTLCCLFHLLFFFPISFYFFPRSYLFVWTANSLWSLNELNQFKTWHFELWFYTICLKICYTCSDKAMVESSKKNMTLCLRSQYRNIYVIFHFIFYVNCAASKSTLNSSKCSAKCKMIGRNLKYSDEDYQKWLEKSFVYPTAN